MRTNSRNDPFNILYVVVSIVLMGISLLPLLHNILARESWRGYGWGAYIYINQRFEVSYSDVLYGGNKPIIRIYPPSYHFAKPVDLVEFSGHESYVCGYNMFNDATNVTINKTGENVLKVFYSYAEMNLVQEMMVLSDRVIVKYESFIPCNIHITIWRWYYQTVENISSTDIKTNSVEQLNVTSTIHFTFDEERKSVKGKGIIEIDKPVKAYVMRDSNGINKIGIIAENASKIVFIVKGDLEGGSSQIYIPDVLSNEIISYLYPIITFILIIYLYKPLRKIWSMLDDKTKILITALIVRLMAAPFTMHLWDINTIQISAYQFVHGLNPYEYVYIQTQRLKTTTGLQINYEGYAYLPHVVLIFSPFYIFYIMLGGDPLPLKGINDPSHVLTFYFHSDIYLFLFIIKLPLIITDLFIISLIYDRFDKKAAMYYAFSPYIIFITSMWGMFDNIVALALLLTIVLLKKNKVLLAGLTYGISLMKFYSICMILPLLYHVWKSGKSRSLLEFIAGLIISQIPTLYYFQQDPVAFLSVTLQFHGTRIGGGVTPLNVLWIIRDFYFNSTVSAIASLVSLSITLAVSIYGIKRNIGLEKAITSTGITVLLGKIVNEQYFIPIYTLLLLYYDSRVAQKLSYGYLAFALIRTTTVYLFFPAIALLGRNVEYDSLNLITKFYFGEPLQHILMVSLYVLGTIVFVLIIGTLFSLLRPEQDVNKRYYREL